MEKQCRLAINEINAVLDKYGLGFEIYVDRDGKTKADIWAAEALSEGIGLTIDTIDLQEFGGKITLLGQTLPPK
tara:strand:- start:40442 stop:40663 length:222 start_codon:yes stop_codon:yes gene_type:complete